ncbi:MAG: glycosyltransferase family 4 protein [Bacteroidota bacterium]
MRIVYVQQLLILPGMSGNQRCWDMAQSWARAGHDVHFLTSDAHFPPTHPWKGGGQFEKDGIKLQVLPVPYDHQMGFLRRSVSFVDFYRKALAAPLSFSSPDVVLAYTAPLSVGELGRRLAARWKCPFVLEVADVWPDVPIGMGILPQKGLGNWLIGRSEKIYQAARHIMCFSEDMQTQIAGHGVEMNKIRVVHNGVTLDRVPFQARQQNGKTEVLYAGTFGKANGVGQIVEAAKIISEQGRDDIHFRLIGDGNEAAMVKARIDSLKLKNVSLHAKVPKEKVASILAGADIGLISFAPFPVLEANAATKFYDYLASGLPTVINYQGWQARYLREYQCGLSCVQGDPEAFAGAILRLADDPALRKQMGRNGRRLAEEQFDRNILAVIALQLLEQSIANYHSVSPH